VVSKFKTVRKVSAVSPYIGTNAVNKCDHIWADPHPDTSNPRPACSKLLCVCECATVSQKKITCSNSYGHFWCKMVSENHYMNRCTLHHSVSVHVSFSVTVTFSWNSALLCHWWPSKIQVMVALLLSHINT